ncbi:MAG: PH domain-containing protein [Actinobacteria bacterium]|nr:PH domain-containing protein [Actinomycetota bacterium]
MTQALLITPMALIGVGIAIHPGERGHPGTAPGYIAFGSVLAALLILLLVGELASRLVLTEQGLTWRYVTRTRSIAWAEIQDVLVVPASGLGPRYSPGIKADDRLIRINSVIGPRRYTERIVTEIRDAWSAASPRGLTADPRTC